MSGGRGRVGICCGWIGPLIVGFGFGGGAGRMVCVECGGVQNVGHVEGVGA